MKYRLRFEVYDNTGTLIVENKLQPELTNPTVGEIKLLLNPGTYTNIKTETFLDGGVPDLIDTEPIKGHFIKYRIDLN
jgi:hypothetical protein